MSDVARFVGTWSLRSFRATAPDGSITHPFGESPTGRITYHADGRMSVQVMAENRPPMSSDDPWQAAPDERAAAFSTFIGYLGRYSVEPEAGEVVHRLEVASIPNWVGTEQRRRFQFGDGTLRLSTPPIVLDGVALESSLLWERD